MTPRLEIEYCTQCRWLLRAAWMAQGLLTTFENGIGEVALIPGTGGIFEARLDGETVFSRKQEGRFPDRHLGTICFATNAQSQETSLTTLAHISQQSCAFGWAAQYGIT